MTDTPAPVSEDGPTPRGESSWWNGFVDGRARALFGALYGLAVVIAAGAIWVVAVAPGAGADGGARAVAGQAVLYVLLGNLVLILGLAPDYRGSCHASDDGPKQ